MWVSVWVGVRYPAGAAGGRRVGVVVGGGPLGALGCGGLLHPPPPPPPRPGGRGLSAGVLSGKPVSVDSLGLVADRVSGKPVSVDSLGLVADRCVGMCVCVCSI